MSDLYYIAGPMTGLPDLNFPAFNESAEYLRAAGYAVINPAELDGEDLGRAWDFYLRRDIKVLADCTHIVMLPGWEKSKGARLEHHIATELGLEVIHWVDGQRPWLKDCIQQARACQRLTDSLVDSTQRVVKDTNPKDAIGVSKVPFSTVPARVIAETGLAMLEGALKYGRHNFRVAGVRGSVYYDAALRHLTAFWEGQDIDPDSGLPHVVKAIACLTVLRDGQIQENWVDDRPPRTPGGWVGELNEKAKALLLKYPDPPAAYTELP